MWKIYEHNDVSKQLASIPINVLKRYEKWKDIVGISGPVGLLQIKGFKDEAFKGTWKGFRSSRLNLQYRFIYKVENENVLIKVVNITPHDYRRN